MIEVAGITITPKFIWLVYLIISLSVTGIVGYFWFWRKRKS
ncbi:MAG: hypothetical protein WCV58_01920 [Patescibacteria group bacterium]